MAYGCLFIDDSNQRLYFLFMKIHIALADLIMQMPVWENPVIDVIQIMSKPPDRIQALIEFLTILPEEVGLFKSRRK